MTDEAQANVKLRQGVKIAAGSGALLGVFIGHIDLLIRVLAKNIEWFEIYLSIILPAVFFYIFFGAIGFIVTLILKLGGVSIGLARQKAVYAFFVISILMLAVIYPSAHYLLYGDGLLWDPKRVNLNAGIFLGFVALLTVVRARGDALFDKLERIIERGRAGRVLGNYQFFALIFCLFSFAYDLYLLKRFPDQPTTSLSQSIDRSKDRPNVILISLDTVRARSVSFNNPAMNTTPELDAVAQNSVVFDRAGSVSSWTLPGHASMFTGKYSFGHRAHEIHQKLDEEQITLAEVLHGAGYRTAGFIGGPYCKAKYGLGQGFQVYHDRLDFFEYRHTYDPLSVKRALDFLSNRLRKMLLQNDGERTAPEINRDVFRWLNRVGDDPFFLFVNYFDAHDPYDLGLEYRHLFTDDELDDDALNEMVRAYYFDPENRYNVRGVDERTRDYLEAMYETEIYYLDRQVRVLLDKLEQEKLLDDTILIITSDHGEEFFEHGGVMHKQTLFEEVLHVPFFIYYPERFESRRVSDRVSLVDLMPTVLELVGIDAPPGLHGQSLVKVMSGEEDARISQREGIISQRYARREHGESYLQALTADSLKYIHVDPEQPRMPIALYDLDSDPLEQANLLSEQSETAKEMADALNGLIHGSESGGSS